MKTRGHDTLYLQTAVSLAMHICREAIWDGNACNWIGCSNEDHLGMPRPFARSLATNFYDGTAGVAFFLCNLLRVHHDEIIRETAEGALQQLINEEVNKEAKENYGKLGFYTGYPGEAFVLLQAADILHKKNYGEAASKLVEKTIRLSEEHWRLDVIDGAAGAIPCLLSIAKKQPDKELLKFINTLGDYLLQQATASAGHLYWDTMPGSSHPLTGFGHGAAGIAAAFMELYAFHRDEKYLNIANKAFAYENLHFNSEQQNWPDFRNHPYQPAEPDADRKDICGMAWCHGAPGIALSRLRAFQLTGDATMQRDAEAAVETTLQHFSASTLASFSLCHGLLGNAETLLYASEVLKRPSLKTSVENTIRQALEQTTGKGLIPVNGLHNFNETPDYMLGYAGMGYSLLRLYDSRLFPATLIITNSY